MIDEWDYEFLSEEQIEKDAPILKIPWCLDEEEDADPMDKMLDGFGSLKIEEKPTSIRGNLIYLYWIKKLNSDQQTKLLRGIDSFQGKQKEVGDHEGKNCKNCEEVIKGKKE